MRQCPACMSSMDTATNMFETPNTRPMQGKTKLVRTGKRAEYIRQMRIRGCTQEPYKAWVSHHSRQGLRGSAPCHGGSTAAISAGQVCMHACAVHLQALCHNRLKPHSGHPKNINCFSYNTNAHVVSTIQISTSL